MTQAPENDVEQLRRDIRIAILDNDHERRNALELRYQQWKREHSDQIEAAQQRRQERDAADIAEQKSKDASVKTK
jgi:hypothetical protein